MGEGTSFPLPTIKVWRCCYLCWIIPFVVLLLPRSVATSSWRWRHRDGGVNLLHSHDTRLLRGLETIPSRHLFTNDSRPPTTSSQCTAVRTVDDYYTAELQLYYVYAVEFAAHAKSRSLAGLEAVITTAILESLADLCDELDRPMYKVLTTMRHQFSKDGK